jgi:LAO/AO transport system kinase
MVQVDAILEGDRRALARLLTLVENDDPQGRAALDELYSRTGNAHVVGITGAPGTGKSSFTNQLARVYRDPPSGDPRQVAIVAVDPSSPFTGGAILGDRVRMKDHSGDPGVFIRSMASRGAVGGIARATAEVTQVLDAAGFDTILVETVGAGQSEVEIARLAHTTIVVEAPGLGDDIQAIKAGILEIADILVVNKADLPGAEKTEQVLRASLEMGAGSRRPAAAGEEVWTPAVLKVQSINPVGIIEAYDLIQDHRAYLERTGEWLRRDRERLDSELEDLLKAELFQRWVQCKSENNWQAALDELYKRKRSPYQTVDILLKQTSEKDQEIA